MLNLKELAKKIEYDNFVIKRLEIIGIIPTVILPFNSMNNYVGVRYDRRIYHEIIKDQETIISTLNYFCEKYPYYMDFILKINNENYEMYSDYYFTLSKSLYTVLTNFLQFKLNDYTIKDNNIGLIKTKWPSSIINLKCNPNYAMGYIVGCDPYFDDLRAGMSVNILPIFKIDFIMN